jgi:hypothetical protein
MKKSKVEPLQESLLRISENSLKRLDQKGIETDHNFCVHVMGNGQMFLGSLVASKVFRIMHDVELGKPYMFLIGRNPARGNNDIEGRGDGKKQMAAYNELHRGFALARKGADLPEVFHCMNRDKPRNVRQSITPKSEILTDTCVNGLYAGITKTAFRNENCRPIKGDEMLERYEGKLSRTVLRGGGASNCSFLLGRFVVISQKSNPISYFSVTPKLRFLSISKDTAVPVQLPNITEESKPTPFPFCRVGEPEPHGCDMSLSMRNAGKEAMRRCR